MLTLRKIENVPTGQNNRPKLVVKVTGAYVGWGLSALR
jgi:peptidyl-prolyl isomerase H (cyclophilin H)